MDFTRLYSKAGQVGLAQGATGAAAGNPDVISLAFGLPDPDSFPRAELEAASATVLAEQADRALQYGPPQGEPRLRSYLAERLSEQEGLSLDPEQVAVTSGSSQAIGLIAQLMVDPGDTILLEGPTFLGAIRLFRLAQARMEELPLDQSGLVVDELRRRLERLAGEGVRPKFLYTLPTFHNPAGVTMSLERRLQLLELAQQRDLLVVEDDAYGDLRFSGPDLPSLLALDRNGRVLRLGTFSKILAAGLRLGWATGPRDLVEALPVVKSDGGTNPYGAHLAASWATSGRLEPHVDSLRAIYRQRRDAMIDALEHHCASFCRWTKPDGGFFVWVELNDGLDPDRLRHAAQQAGVAYLPGSQCFASGRGERFLRLSFSFLPPEKIEQGIQRLGTALAAAQV